jgi:hypothetical protein
MVFMVLVFFFPVILCSHSYLLPFSIFLSFIFVFMYLSFPVSFFAFPAYLGPISLFSVQQVESLAWYRQRLGFLNSEVAAAQSEVREKYGFTVMPSPGRDDLQTIPEESEGVCGARPSPLLPTMLSSLIPPVHAQTVAADHL